MSSAFPAELTTRSAAYAGLPAEALLANPEAVKLGGQLFRAHCADCHDTAADSTRGVPALTGSQLSYGDDTVAIRRTIAEGRRSVMPGIGSQLGEVDIGQLVAFVQALERDAPLNDFEKRGAGLYTEHCASCHGEEAGGKPELGAPDLTDESWQHGGSMMNIRLVITRGAESICPAHRGELSDAEIELLTAYTLHLVGDSRGGP